MLPVILGTVALGAVGYGIKKCMNDENCSDNVKDKISDGLIKVAEGIDNLEKKIGLNEVTFENEFNFDTQTSEMQETKKTNVPNDFEKLYQLKIDICNKVLEYKIGVIEENEIKKDKTKGVIITEEMETNLASYVYILKTAFNKIKYNIDNKTDVDNMQYVYLLKDLYLTKIIKRGKLNDKSTEVILKAMRVLLGKKEPILVELDIENKIVENKLKNT
ncbi:MAG: hypothetical protein DRG78_12940 [Epsilonproteobacteria bacterium]|nr:MAG: hypothetical protein DRG78_12940 [Campylobacterota bacterium]